MNNLNYRSELAALTPGLDVNRYYDAWRLLLLLWRDLWWHSNVDWSKYRLDIWSKFTERIQSAARTAGDLDAFLSRFSRLMSLTGLGGNEDDRAELARLLALPDGERRRIMRLLRDDAPVLVALVRRWKDANKETWRALEAAPDDRPATGTADNKQLSFEE
jgi:hypothetical protein